MVTPTAKFKDGESESQHLFTLFSKLLTGLISLSVTVSICLAGWSLKETYAAQLSIREIQTHLHAIDLEREKMDARLTANTQAVYKIQLVEQSIHTMQDDLKSIKADIRTLLDKK